MGDEVSPAALGGKWMEDPRIRDDGVIDPGGTHEFNSLVLAGARVSVAEPGHLVCSLRVSAPLTDAEGRWHAGAIAAAVDNMSSTVVFMADGAHVVTVHVALSYFSPAHLDEEVEMEGRVVSRKGKLTATAVEVRNKESGELVAVARQWMTPAAFPTNTNRSSKL
nr:unnamed protein product [Digitaria exilis]